MKKSLLKTAFSKNYRGRFLLSLDFLPVARKLSPPCGLVKPEYGRGKSLRAQLPGTSSNRHANSPSAPHNDPERSRQAGRVFPGTTRIYCLRLGKSAFLKGAHPAKTKTGPCRPKAGCCHGGTMLVCQKIHIFSEGSCRRFSFASA